MGILRSVFEMLPDVAGILLAALSVSLIFFTKELKALEAKKWKLLRWSLAAIFAVVGIGGLVSNSLQKAKDKSERGQMSGQIASLKDQIEEVKGKLNQNTNASVTMWALAPQNGAQEVSAEQPIKFNVAYGVTQNTAKNMRLFNGFEIENGIHDKDVWARFKGVSAQGINDKGQDVVAGNYDWSTLTKTLSPKDAKGILAGTKTLYVLGLVQWNNLSGTDGHLDVCYWLQKPNTKILTERSAIWHQCSL